MIIGHIKQKLFRFINLFLVFILSTAWIFLAWPQILNFPPAVEIVQAAGEDFKIQRGTFYIDNTSDTGTIAEGVDFDECSGDCFIKHVSTRNTSMGPISGGTNENLSDYTSYISDDSGLTTPSGTITFERHSNNDTNRIAWEIWEYIGPASGDNEMQVLDTGVCTFGSANTTCDGAAIAGGAADDSDVVVFVTGKGNPATNRADMQMAMVTAEWVSASDLPRFTRGESGNAADISYAVVEFTGTNWNVQRVPHVFSASATQTETITSVGDISKAFFHHQQRNDGGNSYDGLCQGRSEVELTAPTTLTYRLPQDTTNWGSNMNSVTWVIWNTQSSGDYMIVDHYNPTELSTGGSEEYNWQVSITTLTYATTAAAITGLSGQSAGCGTVNPRGYLIARLTDASTVDFWEADTGQPQEYTFQVTQFPTAPVVSISVTTNGTVAFGNVNLSAEQDTTSSGVDDTEVVQNNGNLTENFNIKTSNATGGTSWSVGSTAGSDVFVMSFSTNDGGDWEILNTVDTYETLSTGIAVDGSVNLDLKIGLPSATTDYQQKTITLTVQAVAP